jgi:hypothetical protein
MNTIKRTYLFMAIIAICAVVVWSCERGGSAPPPKLRGTRINEEWFCYL